MQFYSGIFSSQSGENTASFPLRAVVLSLVCVLTLAACGSDDDDDNTSRMPSMMGGEPMTLGVSDADSDGNILGGTAGDTLNIAAGDDDSGVTGYISLGAGADEITIERGTWVGYHSEDGEAVADGGNQCAPVGSTATDRCIYSGGGADTLTLGDDVRFSGSFVNEGDTIVGNIVMTDDSNYLETDAVPTDGMDTPTDTYVDAGGGADTIEITGGEWVAYDGATSGATPATIYGGAGEDTFTLSGGTITGNVIGENYDDGGTSSDASDDQSGDDTITISSDGNANDTGRAVAGYVHGGSGDDTIEIGGGEWTAYDGSDGVDDGDCDSDTTTPSTTVSDVAGCIYGGEDDDTFTLSDTATITGNVVGEGSGSGDTITISSTATMVGGNDEGRAVAGYVDGSGGEDTITIEAGAWAGYDGGAAPSDTSTIDAGTIYGGNADDEFTLSGEATITGDVVGDGDIDTITISSDGSHDGTDALPVSGYVDGGGDNDVITISAGTWLGYDGDTGSTDGNIYGGANADTFTLSGTATITGDVVGASNVDTITISSDGSHDGTATLPVGGVVSGLGGDDVITISAGTWVGYHGGGGDASDGACRTSSATSGCIYGNGDEDRFHLNGVDATAVTIGPVIGDSGANTADRIILSGGTLDYIDAGGDSDIVRILGTIGGSGSGADIVFEDDCSDPGAGANAVWICGGSGTDKIQYLETVAGLMASITTANTEDIDNGDVCAITIDGSGTLTEGTCGDPVAASLSQPFAIEIEQVGVSSELGLWGGLSSALQAFGREMIADFTSGTTGDVPHGTAHLFSGKVQSHGMFHAREVQLRGDSTTHLSLQGVPGAVGTASYSHDVNLIQHGFSTPVVAGLVAQGGFHLMQGSLTSSDSADQFGIEGYGAGMKLAYGSADIAMLGAWFDLASDDWGRPMDFSGTQWIVSAGVEREMTIGGLSITPQARGFWQQTDIEDQGALRFSDEMIFTGEVGLVAQAGNHLFDVFFTRDDEASSLNTGLVQNHRMEEAVEAGWRNHMLGDDYSITSELRFRHGLETGVDSYSAGVALNRAF